MYQRIKEIDINLTTNQDFSCDNSSWRMQENFPGQSMLNEFGSHCINIALAFSGDLGFIALSSESNKVCMQSAVAGDHIANIQLYGGARDVRKSVFTIAVTTENFVYETDLYSFQKRLIDGELVEKVSLATQGISAAAYLRGIDFSEQMTSFLSGKYENSDIIDSRRTDRIISEIQGSLTNA